MLITSLALSLAATAGTPASAAAPPDGVAVVIDAAESEDRPELRTIAVTLRARPGTSFDALNDADLSDPILRGRLLARLETRRMVVAVGDAAAEFATRELSDVPVYFVDVRLIRGDRLVSELVSGTFSYSVADLLDAVMRLKRGGLGLAYTPGYEPVADWVRRGAAERGLALTERRIAGPRDVAPALRGLLDSSASIWVVGDPLLARGAGFEFLRQRALPRRVALVMPDAWSVRRGALLAFQGDAGPFARRAAAAIDAELRGAPRPRLLPAPSRGKVLVNGALVEKWRIEVPTGGAWRLLR